MRFRGGIKKRVFLWLASFFVLLSCVAQAGAASKEWEDIGKAGGSSFPPVSLARLKRDFGVQGVSQVRKAFIASLPPDRQATFQLSPTSWQDRVYDLISWEGMVASSAFSYVVASFYGRRTLQTLLDNSTGQFFKRNSLTLADLGVNLLCSHSFDDLLFRSGIDIFTYLFYRNLDYAPILLMRYLLSHAELLYNTLPDILNSQQANIRGVRKLSCLNSRICDAVSIYYHSSDEQDSPVTGEPWLSLEFPWQVREYEPADDENGREAALINLRRWALAEGVDAVHLYPGIDNNGQPVLQARAWRSDDPGNLYSLPGHYGFDIKAIWWTSLVSKRGAQFSEYYLIDPLHVNILSQLVTLFSGETTSPVHVQGNQVGIRSNSLLAVNSGELGGIIIDNHLSQGYELPDIYLDVSLKVNDVLLWALAVLSQQRTPAPARGALKLARGVFRSTFYRAAFEWTASKLPEQNAVLEENGASAGGIRVHLVSVPEG